jgi:ABC-2 type transport system permease protein
VSVSIVPQLIWKDLRLNRFQIAITVAAGVLALAVLQQGGEVPFVLGTTWFFISIIVLASMLPISVIVNERKKQTLAFLMSLPLSATQYTAAKALSALLMFLVPWLILVICAAVVVTIRNVAGLIPPLLILGLMPVVGFSVILATALVTESEQWALAATIGCNSSYGIAWYLISRMPSLAIHWNGRVAVWDPPVLHVLSAELGVIALAVVITFFLQSRKRDFI